MQDAAAEPATEEDTVGVAASDDAEVENKDESSASATAENSDDRLERKPEEELFVLVDDDLDNDIISSHAAAFHRVDPELELTPVTAAVTASTPSKTSAAEDDATTKTAEKDDAEVSHDAGNEDTAAAKTKISEKPAPKRLVTSVHHQHSQDCDCLQVPLQQVTTLQVTHCCTWGVLADGFSDNW